MTDELLCTCGAPPNAFHDSNCPRVAQRCSACGVLTGNAHLSTCSATFRDIPDSWERLAGLRQAQSETRAEMLASLVGEQEPYPALKFFLDAFAKRHEGIDDNRNVVIQFNEWMASVKLGDIRAMHKRLELLP
jgi:hypothetical protein